MTAFSINTDSSKSLYQKATKYFIQSYTEKVKKTREELKGSQGAKSRECYQSTSEEIMTMENFYNS